MKKKERIIRQIMYIIVFILITIWGYGWDSSQEWKKLVIFVSIVFGIFSNIIFYLILKSSPTKTTTDNQGGTKK